MRLRYHGKLAQQLSLSCSHSLAKDDQRYASARVMHTVIAVVHRQTRKKDTTMHGCCGALKYCCSCCRQPSECEDPAKMTHSRMAFARRDLCCSVRKVSSDQLCLLASADSEGERGRTGVASVSECARASQRRCVLFYQS